MAITLPNSLANGSTADATEVMENFQAITSVIEAGLPTSYIANPKALFALSGQYIGTVSSGGSVRVLDFEVPSTQAWTLVEAQFAFTSSSGSPTVSMEVLDDGVSVFSTGFSTGTADTVQNRSTFANSTLAGGSRIKVTISTATADAVNVYGTLVLKATHQA